MTGGNAERLTKYAIKYQRVNTILSDTTATTLIKYTQNIAGRDQSLYSVLLYNLLIGCLRISKKSPIAERSSQAPSAINNENSRGYACTLVPLTKRLRDI